MTAFQWGCDLPKMSLGRCHFLHHTQGGCVRVHISEIEELQMSVEAWEGYPAEAKAVAKTKRLIETLTKLSAVCEIAKKKIDEQAEDDGLWFDAVTAPEAYLQQELRDLHRVIEAAIAEVDKGQGPDPLTQ